MQEMIEIYSPTTDPLCQCGHGKSTHDLATEHSNHACLACNSIEADDNPFPAGEGCQGFVE